MFSPIKKIVLSILDAFDDGKRYKAK